MPGSAKALPALFAYRLRSPERLVKLVLNGDAVAADATAKPGGEWLLVGKRTGFHRPKLGRQELRIAASDTEDHERAGVPYHGRSHRARELVGVLVRKREVCCEFARLR